MEINPPYESTHATHAHLAALVFPNVGFLIRLPFYKILSVVWARCNVPIHSGYELNKQWRKNKGDCREEFYKDVYRGARCVFKRITNCIPHHRGFMGFRPLSAVHSGLYKLLRVIPCAPPVIHKGCNEDSTDCSDHKERSHCFSTETKLLEHESHQYRHTNSEKPRGNHLLERALRNDVNRPRIIRF